MFDTVAAAPEEVAGPAVLAGGSADALSNLIPFGRMICFLIAFEDLGLGNWIAGAGRKFLVGSGLLMADQAVDLALIREIEILAFPTITGMTGRATSLVALDIHSEIVDGQPPLAQFLALFGCRIKPRPVDCFMELRCRFRVTGQAGFGHFRPGFKFLLQGLVLGMISGDPQFLGFGGLLCHRSARCLLFIYRLDRQRF